MGVLEDFVAWLDRLASGPDRATLKAREAKYRARAAKATSEEDRRAEIHAAIEAEIAAEDY